jgi:hypothetical protein
VCYQDQPRWAGIRKSAAASADVHRMTSPISQVAMTELGQQVCIVRNGKSPIVWELGNRVRMGGYRPDIL